MKRIQCPNCKELPRWRTVAWLESIAAGTEGQRFKECGVCGHRRPVALRTSRKAEKFNALIKELCGR